VKWTAAPDTASASAGRVPMAFDPQSSGRIGESNGRSTPDAADPSLLSKTPPGKTEPGVPTSTPAQN